ncbi:MAG: hypothetical protein AB7F89_04135 [Pirellulaceae bacterium]
MLLTITTTYRPANELGYLLHKHPNRLFESEVEFVPDVKSLMTVVAGRTTKLTRRERWTAFSGPA